MATPNPYVLLSPEGLKNLQRISESPAPTADDIRGLALSILHISKTVEALIEAFDKRFADWRVNQ